MAELLAYLAIGTVTGFLAGLLGIGGGVIIVSSLVFMFAASGYPQEFLMHMAVGTSLAAIIVGSWASFRAHHRRGSVDWPVVYAMSPGLLAGVFAGAVSARFLGGTFLKFFFLGFVALLIVQLMLNAQPRPSRGLPGRGAMAAVGAGIGVCSSWFGGGAAAVGVPFLTWCNVGIHRAIGTVAAMGFPIAIAGTLGYVVSGWGVPGMPPWSAGFVYLPAFAGISATSMLAAPLGARLAHRLQGPTLRRIFAAFLMAVAAKIAVSV